MAILSSCQKDNIQPIVPNQDSVADSTDTPNYPAELGQIVGCALSAETPGDLVLVGAQGIAETWYSQTNNEGFGSTCSDIVYFDNYYYISVPDLNCIMKVNATTGKNSGQIALGNLKPKFMLTHGGKLYVSSSKHSVSRIDLATDRLESTCRLSATSAGRMCIIGSQLFVCNGWEDDSDGFIPLNHAFSVVDLHTFTQTGTIGFDESITSPDDEESRALQPIDIKALDNHHLVVTLCEHAHASTLGKMSLAVIDIDNLSWTLMAAGADHIAMDVDSNTIYSHEVFTDANANRNIYFYKRTVSGAHINVETTINPSVYPLMDVTHLCVHPATHNLYCYNCPARQSTLYVFSPSGNLIYHSNAGQSTSGMAFCL